MVKMHAPSDTSAMVRMPAGRSEYLHTNQVSLDCVRRLHWPGPYVLEQQLVREVYV